LPRSLPCHMCVAVNLWADGFMCLWAIGVHVRKSFVLTNLGKIAFCHSLAHMGQKSPFSAKPFMYNRDTLSLGTSRTHF
jgi:hypothetical protein